MKRLTILSIVAAFVMAVAVTPTFAAISMSGQVASGAQQIETDAGADQSLGFNDPAANLQVYGDVGSGVDAYVDLLSRVSNGNNGAFEVNEAYITLDELSQAVDVKVGQYAIDFGNQHMRRSTNADVQDNPLVGNSLVDPYDRQSGVEVSGSANRFAWSAGITNGANTANFDDNSGYGITGKVWGDFTPGLSGAVSYYTTTHDNGSTSTTGIFSGGESYEGAALNQQASLNSTGEDVAAWQLDLGYDLSAHNVPASIDAWYGDAEDESTATTQEMSYYGLLTQYDINPQTYVAARYEVATDDDQNNNEQSDRIQVGAGYNLNSNTLAKVEYVTQEDEANGPVGTNQEFDGFIGELSVSF